MTATVRRILIYPIKSLDPVPVSGAAVLGSGALARDREFALTDDEGRVINGKREARIHCVRSEFDLENNRVSLRSSPEGAPESFHLVEDRSRIEGWFSAFLGFRAHLERNTDTGFPDDLESPGPTVCSGLTFNAVGAWFGLQREETSRRFRVNIELETDAPFWEDRLFSGTGAPLPFAIGGVRLSGVNPCQRCAVPSRDSRTGIARQDFQREFMERRKATLPEWAAASRFDHYYRLSVNTRIPATEAGKMISVGDPVTLG
ncbi:MAG TPA: MOSC N-terminal beta barrel domain-containing protein [Terriglobia bacterium]|nr:MOSC N-terminal beta barrel domain-containing protein [Terriglobia bacterium]